VLQSFYNADTQMPLFSNYHCLGIQDFTLRRWNTETGFQFSTWNNLHWTHYEWICWSTKHASWIWVCSQGKLSV